MESPLGINTPLVDISRMEYTGHLNPLIVWVNADIATVNIYRTKSVEIKENYALQKNILSNNSLDFWIRWIR